MKKNIEALSDTALTWLLILSAVVIVIIALQKDRPLFKAATFLYVILP